MARNQNLYTLRGTRVRETDKAVKFKILEINGDPLDNSSLQWFPFSQVSSSMTDPHSTDCDELVVSEWILQKKGLV